MKFGGHIFQKWTSPEEWAQLARNLGYSAVYFPVDHTADQKLIDGYVQAAAAADLTIAEVGAWKGMMDPDPALQEANIQYVIHQLELADYVHANCCVDISGSYSSQWDAPHRDNLTPKGFDDVVARVQRLLDAVQPTHTVFALEPMQWMYPDSADSYLRLIEAIDRPGFGVHFDPVNVIVSPQLYWNNAALLEEWFAKLGPRMRGCHAKDIVLDSRATVHLDECRPGLGNLDYAAYLTGLSRLDDDLCLMVEHLHSAEEYALATAHIKSVAASLNISL